MSKPNIDSDKLLEWITSNSFVFGGHEDYPVVGDEELRAAIQSGELTLKRVYARAPEGDYGAFGYLTPGREYEVIDDDGEFFDVVEDNGVKIICKWRADDHIYGANWERVEK